MSRQTFLSTRFKVIRMSALYTKQRNFSTFWLFFELIGYGDEWLDVGLPQPTLFIKTHFGAYIGYAIEGFFATERNKRFLRDVFDRLKISFALEKAQIRILPYAPKIDLEYIKENGYICDKVYNLRDDIAKYLKSKKVNKKADVIAFLAQFSSSNRASSDALFDAIRFRVYDFCKMHGKENLTYEYVEAIAKEEYQRIGSSKGWSTAKAKAKAIYNWVKENYNAQPKKKKYIRKMSDKEYEMTRSENITKINKLRAIDRKKRVEKAVESLMFLGEKITVRKVAEYAKVSKDTANKYLREMRESGKIAS